MGYLKMIGLAVLAALVLMAIAGAGSASATVLCKEDKNPCGSDYAAGTEFVAEQMAGSYLRFIAGGTITDECTGSKIAGKTTNTGGSGSAVAIELSTFTWGSCSKSREVTKRGPLEIDYNIWETGYAGTVTMKELEWKEGLCTYGHSNIDMGNITKSETSSSYATLHIDVQYPLISGFGCASVITFAADYTITAPKPLYISES